jgi:hypothetical protein
MKKCKLILFTTLFLLFSINTIPATDCRGVGTPSAELKRATAVFSGKVIAFEHQYISDEKDVDFSGEALLVRIKVDSWWKGSNNTNEVVLRTGTVCFSGATKRTGEDFKFLGGESYLVYAYTYQENLMTNGCTRTKTLSKAEEDLKELGEGVQP